MKILHTQATLLVKRLFRLEKCGRYDEALAELKDIWKDTTTFPDVEEFEPRIAAEIILRCGSLIGFIGHNKQIPNSQEKSKNLLTEARNRFLDIYDVEKIAECENYLARAYWQTGELVEAETWIEEALSHGLSNSNCIRLYSYIIESKVDFANSKYEKILQNFAKLENDFLNYADDCLRGDFYNHYGLALRNIGKTSETLEKYRLAKQFFRKAGHQIYLGTVENNTAYLYKSQNRFTEAHESIDNATNIFKRIKDRTREGFSLDTKAQIYFSERKYTDALTTSEKAITILKKSENKAYLVETYMTKAKTLIYLEDDISAATVCLAEAIQIAKTNISEEAAKNLVREFEKTRQEKDSPVIEEIAAEKTTFSENLELLLPPSLAHYNDLQGVWIKNNHLESVGLRKDSLAIVVQEKIKRGDLVAIAEIANDSVSCGFYDSDFGIVCLEGINSELQLFDEKDIKILGKIVGVCNSEKTPDGKMIVQPIDI
jgi:tetratricopeptide (TPR) repeat protein